MQIYVIELLEYLISLFKSYQIFTAETTFTICHTEVNSIKS